MISRVKSFCRVCGTVCLVLALWACSASGSTEDIITETRTKAQTIYKILQFIEFPENSFQQSEDPITICILGYDSFGKILEFTFKDKKIDGRTIKIIRARKLKDLKKNTDPFQVIYITKSLSKEIPTVLGHLHGKGCLVMGETPRFCNKGGMIEIKVLSSKARFSINTSAAWQADIKISSQLLKLATIVSTDQVTDRRKE